jgi:hypothetical protein
MATQPVTTPSPVVTSPTSTITPETNDLNASRTTKAPVSKETPKATPKDTKVAPDASKPKEAAKNEGKAPFKKYTFNLNGKNVEKSWDSEEAMQRDLQKVFGIEERAQQNAAKIEAAEKLLDYVQGKDPADYKKFVKLCKENQIDYKKFASDILYDEIEEGNLTPEQRELKAYKEREAEAKAEEEAEKAKVAEEEKEQKKTRDIQAFEKEMSDALAKGGYPKTRLTLAILSNYVDAADAANKESGAKIVQSVEQLLPFVQRDLQQLQQETLNGLEGKALLDYIGPDLLEKITKAKVSDYKSEQLRPQVKEVPKPKSTNKKDNSFRTQMNKKPLDDDETGGLW